MNHFVSDPKTFGHIRESWPSAVPDWMTSLDDATSVGVANFPFGELIATAQEGMGPHLDASQAFGIILEGEAEIFEFSAFGKVAAYRPIRILAANDIFGDFSLLDKHNECAGPSRRGEVWTLIAGRRSLFPMVRLDSRTGGAFVGPTRVLTRLESIEKSNESKEENQRREVPAQIKSERDAVEYECPQLAWLVEEKSELKTKVALIDLSHVNLREEKHARLRIGLHEHGWPRMKAYRDAINSFNWHELLSFRAKAHDWLKRNPGKASKGAFLNPFADALFDALNRPLRGEPGFIRGLPTWMSAVNSELAKNGVNPEKILSAAATDKAREFYFPIDIHNYFVNVAANFEKTLSGKDIVDVGKQLTVAFGETSKSTVPPYIRLANAMIEKFRDANKGYPYNVVCEWSGHGGHREMVMLRFNSK